MKTRAAMLRKGGEPWEITELDLDEPYQPLVEAFLAATGKDPDEVIGTLEQVGRDCTVYLAAVNAAMARCLPEYFPVVLAAFDALMRERAARGGGWQSTSGPAPMIVVNGPIRHDLGFNTAGGAFGPGFRPNATVACAIGLIVRNAFGIRPHVLEQATQGLPGRWSICLAENEEESPWPPFASDAGQPAGTSAVSATLLRICEFVDNRHTPTPSRCYGTSPTRSPAPARSSSATPRPAWCSAPSTPRCSPSAASRNPTSRPG